MNYMLKLLILAIVAVAVALPVYGDDLTAQDIFEGMIYYENDQMTAAGHNDYHCIVKQTTFTYAMPPHSEDDKDVYFMVPVYRLEMYGDRLAYIYEPDAIITTLEIQELERKRDESINGVDCYVIRLTPKDERFERFPSTYFIAKDDFRKVRTVNFGSSAQFDRVKKTLDYTYTEIEGMMLMNSIVALFEDEEGNEIQTVTAEYTDYEFDIGLTERFFTQHNDEITINPPYN